MSDETRSTHHILGGLIGVFFILIFGSMYLIHLSAVQTQNFINQQAIARAARPAPTDAQLLNALNLNSAPTGSDPIAIPVVTAPDGLEAPPPSVEPAAIAEPQLPWLPVHMQMIKDFFKPPKKEPAVPATPTAAQVDAAFDQAPAARPAGESDDDGSNNEERELTWKNPPSGIHLQAGDLIEMSAPGLKIDRVEVAGVITEGARAYWLLKAGGADYDALEKVIQHRPKHLKIVVQN